MHREALALHVYIDDVSEDEEKLFQYRRKVLPLVKVALDSTLAMPYKGDEPYSWRLMLEGLAPMLTKDFTEIYCAFMNRIVGSSVNSTQLDKDGSRTNTEIIQKDGERYKWVEYED